MTAKLTIESASVEAAIITVKSETDPTGGAVEFELTANTVTTPTGSWSAGSWDGSWDSTTKKVDANTPTIGSAGTLVIAEGSRYTLWVRFSSTVIKRAATIIAN